MVRPYPAYSEGDTDQQPTAADIKRKNANFAARAQAGKNTRRPARSGNKANVGLWVVIIIGVLAGGTCESFPHPPQELNVASSGVGADQIVLLEFLSLFFFKKRLTDLCASADLRARGMGWMADMQDEQRRSTVQQMRCDHIYPSIVCCPHSGPKPSPSSSSSSSGSGFRSKNPLPSST